MEPVKVGENYVYSYAGDYQQIVNPATNTTGVVIRTAYLQNVNVFSGQSKPSFVSERAFPIVMTANATPLMNPFPILVPPGYGLWVSGGNTGVARITYDVLA